MGNALFDETELLKMPYNKFANFGNQLLLGTKRVLHHGFKRNLLLLKETPTVKSFSSITINSFAHSSKKITAGFRINTTIITSYEHNTILLTFVPKGIRSKQIKVDTAKKSQMMSPYTEKPFVLCLITK
jgi:hypothetical protein